MQAQQLSPSGPNPGMYGSDRDIFLRVWQRVMPDVSPTCPILVDPPAQTLPVTPTLDSCEDDFPSREDVPCLGCGAQSEGERLREFIARELACWKAYQYLSRRANGQSVRVLSSLAACCRQRAKRLSAALFLASGVRFFPAGQTTISLPRSYFGALREHFLAEQDRGCAYRAAADECMDLCLHALYLQLADECMEHAGRIRTLLEHT